MLKIVLLSINSAKVKAALDTIEDLRLSAKIHLLDVAIRGDKPFNEEVLSACQERLNKAELILSQLNFDYDVLVAIEGGFFKEDPFGTFVQSVCGFKSTNGLFFTKSAQFPISNQLYCDVYKHNVITTPRFNCLEPEFQVDLLSVSKPQTKLTFQSIEQGLEATLSNGRINRQELIAQALKIGFAHLYPNQP